VATVGVLLVALSGTASAHAQLESTDPPQSSVQLVAPNQVVLHFGEPVEIDFGSVRVLGPRGQRVDSGGAHHPSGDSHAVATSLPGDLPRGTYVVAWRVISADSHPVHGAFVFSVGTASGASRASAEAASLANQAGSPAVGAIYWTVRFAAFVGLLLLAGLPVMVGLAWRTGGATRRVRRILWGSWAVLFVATLLGIAVQGVYAAALPIGDLVRPSLAVEVLHTRFGRIEVARLLVLAAFVPVLFAVGGRLGGVGRRWRWVVPATAILGLGLLATPGLAGHASTGDQPTLGLALDLVHLAAAAVWIGGLVLLATFLVGRVDDTEQPADPVGVTLSVSSYAFTAVICIIATGTVQAIRQVGTLYALLHTAYGQILLVKIALVIVLVALGAMSRRIVHGGWGMRYPGRPDAVPAAGRDPVPPGVVVPVGAIRPTGQAPVAVADRQSVESGTGADQVGAASVAVSVERRRLRRSVLVELGLVLAVLAVTAALVNTVPAKQAAGAPFSTSFTTLGVQVNAQVEPARSGGGNEVHVYLLNQLGTPRAVPEFDMTLSLPSAGIGPLAIPLRLGGPGHYYASNVNIPLAGTWVIRFTVRTDAINESVTPIAMPVH
jgi:copper transport protein